MTHILQFLEHIADLMDDTTPHRPKPLTHHKSLETPLPQNPGLTAENLWEVNLKGTITLLFEGQWQVYPAVHSMGFP